MPSFPHNMRLSAKSENCENSRGFYDAQGVKIHDAIPQELLVEIQYAPPIDPIQAIYVKEGGPNVIWPISARGLAYRGRP